LAVPARECCTAAIAKFIWPCHCRANSGMPHQTSLTTPARLGQDLADESQFSECSRPTGKQPDQRLRPYWAKPLLTAHYPSHHWILARTRVSSPQQSCSLEANLAQLLKPEGAPTGSPQERPGVIPPNADNSWCFDRNHHPYLSFWHWCRQCQTEVQTTQTARSPGSELLLERLISKMAPGYDWLKRIPMKSARSAAWRGNTPETKYGSSRAL
jgi:hypothetical protein